MMRKFVGLLLLVMFASMSCSVVLAESGGGKSYLPLVFGAGAKSPVFSATYTAAFARQDMFGEKIKLVRSKDWGWDELAEFKGPNPLPDEMVVFENKDTGPCLIYRLYSVRAVLLLKCQKIAEDPQVLYMMYNSDTFTNLSAVFLSDKLLLVWQEGQNVIYSAQLSWEKDRFVFVVLDSWEGFAPAISENGEAAFYGAIPGSSKIGLFVADSSRELSSATLVDSWGMSGIIGDVMGQMIALSPNGLLAYSKVLSNAEYPIARGVPVREAGIRAMSWYDDTTLLVQTGGGITAVIHACSVSAGAWRCVPLTNGYSPVQVGEGLVAHLYMDSSPLVGDDESWAKPCITKLFPRVEMICLDNPQNADYMYPRRVLILN